MCVISITYPSFSDVFLRDAEACCLYRRNCMISFLRGGFLTFKIVSCRVGVNPLLLFFTCCRFPPFSAKGSDQLNFIRLDHATHAIRRHAAVK